MALETVGILSPGDMGHAVGHVLGAHGLRVITCLAGRSARTRQLSEIAGIEAVGSYEALVSEAELLLSILVPAQAESAAQRVAQALQGTGADLVYADCNAIAPETTLRIAEIIQAAGGRFVDASIVGGPPKVGSKTRLYASGPHAARFGELRDYGLNAVVMGEAIGQASAIKMCYAALTKGSTALYTELLTAAKRLGIWDAFKEELFLSQGARYEGMERGLPTMPAKSRRWVGEMEEIAKTFEAVGLTPRMLLGAADMYRLVGSTPLADRNPEDPEPLPSLEEMIALLAGVPYKENG